MRRYARSGWTRTSRVAPGNSERINTPAFARPSVIAGHPPTEPNARKCLNGRHVNHGRDEAIGVTAPRLTTCDGAASISADCAVIASTNEAPSSGNNILKGISPVGAQFEHATVEPEVRILIRRFEIEIVPERQLSAAAFEEREKH
jgi:hypothetical protein